jgi:hypothetical protein
MPRLGFVLRVLPTTLLGIALTLVGVSLTQGRLGATPFMAALIGACIGYVGSLAFHDTRGWNLGFFAAFSSLAGAVLGNLLPSSGGLSWILAFLYAGAVIGTAAALAPWLGRWVAAMAFSLQALFWLYVAGWVLIALLRLPRLSMRLWAGAGLLVFFGLGAAWFHGFSRQAQPPAEWVHSRAFSLYVLAFNLAIAIRVLSLGLGD